jgi:hypothetical protein
MFQGRQMAPETKASAALGIASDTLSAKDQAKDQLKDDYPPETMAWMDTAEWRGPEPVPLDRVDYAGKAGWAASRPGQQDKVDKFEKRIRNGWQKPVILAERPGSDLAMIVDGHHRALAAQRADQPLMALVAKVPAKIGPWSEMHDKQRSDTT